MEGGKRQDWVASHLLRRKLGKSGLTKRNLCWGCHNCEASCTYNFVSVCVLRSKRKGEKKPEDKYEN